MCLVQDAEGVDHGDGGGVLRAVGLRNMGEISHVCVYSMGEIRHIYIWYTR